MKEIKLGDVVRDKITGFKGIAIAKCEYLYGCAQFCIKPQKLSKEGSMLEGQYIDIEQLEIIDKEENKIGFKKEPTGGL